MQKITKSVNLIAIVFMLIVVNSCTKDDLIVFNDDGTEWNTGTDYPYILPNAMNPYQYAVYQEDIGILFDYMHTVFNGYKEGDERGYFILFSNDANHLIYCGYVSESSDYFDPDIFIDNPDDPFIVIDDNDDDEVVYGCNKISTKNENRFDRWVERKVEKGYTVREWKDGDRFCAVAKKN